MWIGDIVFDVRVRPFFIVNFREPRADALLIIGGDVECSYRIDSPPP
jgi:hypothetical protein